MAEKIGFINEGEVTEPGRLYLCRVNDHPLATGSHTIRLLRLPQGSRIIRCDLILETAAVNSGGATLGFVQWRSTGTVRYIGNLLGYDLENTAPAYVNMDDGTDGANAGGAVRPKTSDNDELVCIVSNVTAAAASAAQFTVAVLASRELPAQGP